MKHFKRKKEIGIFINEIQRECSLLQKQYEYQKIKRNVMLCELLKKVYDDLDNVKSTYEQRGSTNSFDLNSKLYIALIQKRYQSACNLVLDILYFLCDKEHFKEELKLLKHTLRKGLFDDEQDKKEVLSQKSYSRKRRILDYIECLQEEVNKKIQVMDYDKSKIINNYFKLLEEHEELIHEKEMLEFELQELKIKMELNKRA